MSRLNPSRPIYFSEIHSLTYHNNLYNIYFLPEFNILTHANFKDKLTSAKALMSGQMIPKSCDDTRDCLWINGTLRLFTLRVTFSFWVASFPPAASAASLLIFRLFWNSLCLFLRMMLFHSDSCGVPGLRQLVTLLRSRRHSCFAARCSSFWS